MGKSELPGSQGNGSDGLSSGRQHGVLRRVRRSAIFDESLSVSDSETEAELASLKEKNAQLLLQLEREDA